MGRRAISFVAGCMIIVLLGIASALVSTPFVVLVPVPGGDTTGTADGAPLIRIAGHSTYPARGRLDVVTRYAVAGPMFQTNLFVALDGWLSHDAVVPRQEALAGFAGQRAAVQDDLPVADALHSATAAALRELGIRFTESVRVTQVISGLPAAGSLRPGDVITAIRGQKVSDPAAVFSLVDNLAPGTRVGFTVRRRGRSRRFQLRTVPGIDSRSAVGVVVTGSYRFPFAVRMNAAFCGEDDGCALMFALGLVDRLTSAGLAGGRIIAGAGTVSDQGAIGPVYGIGQLVTDASRRGATAFLTPAADCPAAARAAPPGLQLIRVSTLSGAVRALRALRAGQVTPSCRPAGAAPRH